MRENQDRNHVFPHLTYNLLLTIKFNFPNHMPPKFERLSCLAVCAPLQPYCLFTVEATGKKMEVKNECG